MKPSIALPPLPPGARRGGAIPGTCLLVTEPQRRDSARQGFTQRRHVALHELGHALGLGHSFTGEIMQEHVGSIEYVQPHDQYSYDVLWG